MTSAYGHQTSLSLFLIFFKRRWIEMQHDVKNYLRYYPACNLQGNTHIASSKNAMERCGLAKPCGPGASQECFSLFGSVAAKPVPKDSNPDLLY
jgi:hypothetical protein